MLTAPASPSPGELVPAPPRRSAAPSSRRSGRKQTDYSLSLSLSIHMWVCIYIYIYFLFIVNDNSIIIVHANIRLIHNHML